MISKNDVLTLKKRLLLAYIHGAGSDESAIMDGLSSIEQASKQLATVRELTAGDELLKKLKKTLKIGDDFLLNSQIDDYITVALTDTIEQTIDALLESGLVDVVLSGGKL